MTRSVRVGRLICWLDGLSDIILSKIKGSGSFTSLHFEALPSQKLVFMSHVMMPSNMYNENSILL